MLKRPWILLVLLLALHIGFIVLWYNTYYIWNNPRTTHDTLRGTTRGIEYFRWSNTSHYDSNIKQYVIDSFKTDYNNAFGWKWSSDTDSLKLGLDPAGSGVYVLQVFYEKGTTATLDTNGKNCGASRLCRRGAQFYAPLLYRQNKTYAALEYEVYFKDGFEFVKGGKLPGLYGGNRGSCKGCKGVRDCFSARLMWRTGGHYEVYGYITDKQPGGWADWCQKYKANKMIWTCSRGCGSSFGQTYSDPNRFVPGQWYKIRLEIDVGQPNHAGRVAFWVDGVLVVQMTNIILRTTSEIYVDGLLFSTFYGGNTSIYGAHGDSYTYFRNFRISDDIKDSVKGDVFVESN